MAEKQRPVVPGLEGLPDLQPQARGTDSYARPGETQYGHPPQTNPLMQLSHALSAFEPAVQRLGQELTHQYTDAEYAKGEADYYANRDRWNQHIREGTVPPGASPYFIKAAQRAALKTLGTEFQSMMQTSYFGEEGASARSSDDPKALSQFLAGQRQAFVEKNIAPNGKPIFTPLDLQQVFSPMAEQSYRHMQQVHANYRIKERENEAEATATRTIGVHLDNLNLKPTALQSEDERKQLFDGYGQQINQFFYDQREGLVKNGMSPTKANQIITDTIVAKAIETGNRDVLQVLDHIETKGGVLGKTKDAIAKRTAAEEHITSKQIQTEHFDEWKKNSWFREAQQERSVQAWQREDQQYGHEQLKWQRAEGEVAKENMVKTYENRIFDGLRRPDGSKVIDQAMRELERLDTSAALRMKTAVHTLTKQKVDYEDDINTLATLRMDILKDPVTFDPHRLVNAVKSHQLKPSTYLQLADDLSRERSHGDDPLLRQTEYMRMLNYVSTAAMKGTEGTPQAADRISIAADATGIFRQEALAWKQQNPKGTMEQFNVYMRSKIKTVLEAADPELKAEHENTARKLQQKAEEKRIAEQVKKAEAYQKMLDEKDRLAEQQKRKNKK